MAAPHPPSPKPLSKRQHRFLAETIRWWREAGVIGEDVADALGRSVTPVPFDWKRLARYSLVIAVACLVVAVGAILADKALMRLLIRLFDAPAAVKSLAFAALAAAIFRHALRRRAAAPQKLYSNEAIFFVGVLTLATAVGFFGEAIDTGTGHYSILFLIAAVLYALLGLWFPSKQVWVFGLLSLGAWMGTETGYVSGGGAYFLGMNYPLRFVIFGTALVAVSAWGARAGQGRAGRDAGGATLPARLALVARETLVVGLLYLFVALWIMSIFGNYGDVASWQRVRQWELLHWSVLFGAAALAAIWYGLREDDAVIRGFGLTFLGINLYTRFFEYFWDTVHKAVFFAALAVSFWLLGTKSEKIWNLRKER